MSPLEIAANAVTALCILLAARNHIATWAVGIVGCALFAVLFYRTHLYADVVLQVFFIGSSVYGWWHWQRGGAGVAAPVRRTSWGWVAALFAMAAAALGYGALLHRFTDAYAPFADSAVLSLSVLAQLLLMQRRVETWPAWLLVNSIAVPLYASRGLTLTAGLYAAYWCNAWYGWWRWHRERIAHG